MKPLRINYPRDKIITLKRVSPPECEDGVYGVLIDSSDYRPFAVTLEPHWIDNKLNESCIRAGTYICEASYFYTGRYDTYEIKNVKNRENVKFHKLNWVISPKGKRQTEACIGIGESFDPVCGKYGIRESGKGFDEFMKRTAGYKKFTLIILQLDWKGIEFLP